MKRTLQVGGVAAKAGQKMAGFLEVSGTDVRMPITLVNGTQEGKTLLITAGIHGGEYPSIEATIRLATLVQTNDVSGQMILMSLVSPEAFHARQQYILPTDRKNVNRQFPGNAFGTASERIAHAVVTHAARQADAWIDLHGGDIHEALVPVVGYLEEGEPSVQIRTRELVEVFGIQHVMHPKGLPGTTFKTAAALGIPCIIAEAGQCGQLDEESVQRLVRGCTNVARHLGVLPGQPEPRVTLTMFRDYPWVRAEHAGCWYPAVQVGDAVRTGQHIGTIKDYFGTVVAKYSAPADGMVLLLVTSLAMNAGDPLYGLGVA